MIQDRLITAASFTPKSLQHPNAWVGHLPFAAWVIKEIEPNVFVELGTHSGNSYFSFCQAVMESNLSTQCYAVDNWKGDEHAGLYDDVIFTQVNTYNQERFAKFSRFLRMTFDEALNYFADASIGLLHIDGLHTYEAVRHDFETWLPKLEPGAVVMFHDTNVRERNMGVWKLWEELQALYHNNLEFAHSHGLGVLQLNNAPDDKKLEWLRLNSPEKLRLINYFAAIGSRQMERFDLNDLKQHIANLTQAVAERDSQITNLTQAVAERDSQITNLTQAVAERDGQITNLKQTVNESDGQNASLRQAVAERDSVVSQILSSTSWRVTGIFRMVKTFLRTNESDMSLEKTESRQIASDAFLPRNINIVKSIIRTSFFTIKQRGINAIKLCYNRWPWSPKHKLLIKEFCFQHFQQIFRGVPSYEFWMARKATTTLQFSSNTDFVFESVDWSLMLPASAAKQKQEVDPLCEIDVIVPVYRGLDQTRRCINSVLNSKVRTPFRLIVINDASPEDEVAKYLLSLSSSHKILIFENAENIGFTATVNRGMTLSDKNDILLLNSDSEVANDWLDKLMAQAYSDSRVGTVTPFSNNATICNYPTLDGMKKLPDGESVKSLDAAFGSANKGQKVEIPTGVGFCMYIRRECLNEVGLFDVETFGKGYGEENDFCMRATARGWKHLLAADTFVFHEGEVSFQTESNSIKERSMNIMRKRYPEYEIEVAKHVAKNEAYPYIVAATAARFRESNHPVVLHVLHGYGGGTEKYVEELCRNNYGIAKFLIMSPMLLASGKTTLRIRSADPVDALDIHIPVSNVDFLVSLIQSFRVAVVHIHHVLGYSFDLRYLIEKLGKPFFFTVHDYMLICPHIYLMPTGETYCSEPEHNNCNRCLSVDYPQGTSDIIWWRESNSWIFNDASLVICPSHDVVKRCKRYFPNAVYRLMPHEKALSDIYLDINVPALNENEPLRVAILGVLARHKGIELVAETLLLAENNKSPLQFQLIGYAENAMPPVSNKVFSQTGNYVDVELVDKINTFNPHLILFPSTCPETYSYTLTAALKSKRPIVVTNLGALPERVALRPWTWVIDYNISPSQLLDKLCEIRVENFISKTPPGLTQKKQSDRSFAIENSKFYENEYIAFGEDIVDKRIIDIRTPGKITALVLVENVGGQPSPCAYIRLILPLIRERGEKFDLRWVTSEQVMHYAADVLITQRTAVTSIAAIDKIAAHCREKNIRIVYDLDDLLFSLPANHPEFATYALKSSAVFRWLFEADEVWVSTETLRHTVCQINPRTHVVPNFIDDTLWAKPNFLEVKHDRKDSLVRLLYMGTQTHDADFELVKKVLKKLKKEFSERIEISLIGISSNNSSEKWHTTIKPPQAIGSGYPAFVNWICNGMAFDIGIAPLVDNEFNRCKSAMKFLDYSALGLATVASDLNGYALIRNGENGFRVKNTDGEWYTVLKTMITDSVLRRKIQLKSQHEVFERHGYGSVTGYRSKLLTSFLCDDVKRVAISRSITTREITQNIEQPALKVDRNTIASAFLTGVGIEVGALQNPLPVPDGTTVKYVDRMDKPNLYEHYPELRQHNLVDVDFVDDGEKLLTFTDNSQDFVIANHFLEHCEDPIGTLKAFFRILRTGGVVFLALPDKRFTFDQNRERTSLAHLIRDHSDGPITSRFEHFCEWPKFVEQFFGRGYATAEEIEHRARELMNLNYSIHYHVWVPDDVDEMLRYCAEEQGLPLLIEYSLLKDNEMIIILRKKE